MSSAAEGPTPSYLRPEKKLRQIGVAELGQLLARRGGDTQSRASRGEDKVLAQAIDRRVPCRACAPARIRSPSYFAGAIVCSNAGDSPWRREADVLERM